MMVRRRSCLIFVAVCFNVLVFLHVRHEPPLPSGLSDIFLLACPNDLYSSVSLPKTYFDYPGKYNSTQMYLRPVNTLYPELSVGKFAADTKNEMENIFRRGRGLQHYVNERGQSCWFENGIVYQPWRKPLPSAVHATHPSPYASEYEAYVPFREDLFFEGRTPDFAYKTSPKVILWHTPTRYTQPMPGLSLMKSCPQFPCRITTNLSYAHKSAAMIFTAQRISTAPPNRRPDQVFVLHNHEPPYQNYQWDHRFRMSLWQQAFNWTMTYRMDSDFIVPYGIVRRRPKPIENKNYTDIMKNKKKAAVWIVSNCRVTADRNEYVKELQKYIDVDIYGKCGTMKCPHEDDDKCAELIGKQYKFYIAFESSFCPDYLTEKLFHYLTMDTIVVGRGVDQYYRHVPSEIFINTADYNSPRELAEKLRYLDTHDEAYVQMLQEKDKYFSLVEGYPVRREDGSIRFMAYRFESVSLCHVCQRLWNLDLYSKSIYSIHDWFDSKLCHVPCYLR